MNCLPLFGYKGMGNLFGGDFGEVFGLDQLLEIVNGQNKNICCPIARGKSLTMSMLHNVISV